MPWHICRSIRVLWQRQGDLPSFAWINLESKLSGSNHQSRTRRRSSNIHIVLECMPNQSKTTIEDCKITELIGDQTWSHWPRAVGWKSRSTCKVGRKLVSCKHVHTDFSSAGWIDQTRSQYAQNRSVNVQQHIWLVESLYPENMLTLTSEEKGQKLSRTMAGKTLPPPQRNPCVRRCRGTNVLRTENPGYSSLFIE